MRKNILLASLAVLALSAVGVYHYVNHKAASIIGQQISFINEAYAQMAAAGVMPGLSITYQHIAANYWQDDYRLEGLAVQVAAVGTLAEVAHIRVRGFEPGTLADNGRVTITGLKLADGIPIFLPPAFADLLRGLIINTDYQYHYAGKTGELRLSQQLQIGNDFTLNYQLNMLKMQPFWQFARKWTAMDAETQRVYSQSESYQQQLTQALAQGSVQEGQLTLNNSGFIEALYQALRSTPQTAQVVAVREQLEQFLNTDTALPEPIRASLLAFIEKPRSMALKFNLAEPMSFLQIQQAEWPSEVQNAEQLLKFSNLSLTVNTP